MSEITARSWRPWRFQDFVGQEYVITSLRNAIRESKVAHGYIFSGPRGVGKTSIARVFSMALNCLNPKEDLEPCQQCKNCIEIREGRSPDIIEIDGASNRGIDDMREMRSNAQFMPSYSAYKVYIIDEVHMLTTEAFNAILKILEEPPSYLIFLFATTEIHKVKGTIRSRCQQFYLKRLTEEQISSQLEKILSSRNTPYEPKAVDMITRGADGSMRDAQSILDQALIFSEGSITLTHVQEILGMPPEREFLQALDYIIEGNAVGVKALTRELYSRGEDVEYWILHFLEVLRTLLLFQYGAKDTIYLDQEMKSALEARASSFSLYQIQTLIDLFMELFRDIKSSEKEFFFFEGAFLKALSYRSFVNLQSIVQELSGIPIESQDKEDSPMAAPASVPERVISKDSDMSNNSSLPSPTKEESPTVVSVIKPETLSIQEAFKEWRQLLTSPKEQKVVLDVKEVSRSDDGKLNLEFLSKKEKEQFTHMPQLPESLSLWFQKSGIPIQEIVPFVTEIDISKSSKKSKKLSKEEALELFEQELQTTEIDKQ